MENQTTNPTITLELTIEEFNFLHAMLGDMPTKTNAWVLRSNIEKQAHAQAVEKNIPIVKADGQAVMDAA